MTDQDSPVQAPAFGAADGDAPYGAASEAAFNGPARPAKPAQSAEAAAAVRAGIKAPGGRTNRFSLGLLRLLGIILVAAFAGAGSALLVARASGWGAEIVVKQYVTGGGVSDHPADIKALLAAALPAVISVKATTTQSNPFLDPGGGGRVTAEGTGIVIDSSGEILTNAHVVRGVVSGASSVTVTFRDSSTRAAHIVAADSDHDLALLKVDGVKNLPVLELGDSGSAAPGDAVVAIGYALGLDGGPSVTTGIISATGRTAAAEAGFGRNSRLANLLQTDAPISSGDSGGPLLDAGGHVIGINTMVATSTSRTAANGISFAIAADTVKALLPGLRAGG
ncbi:trypsin-like peptidase domain-containing protein [Arthrobacter sp. C9C5]|uniref:S1C family serine protease n=1 Tax=Arthrobacter sp. C9C5 TaxID=2735267 RepID=UPI001584B60D|nr:trypsin-like peptidase domain-containing protein [Arthrobacter sp. C9C5]NUU31543.1 trypsin-like serine protease [Arthrobacter sp. C9C5]